MVPAKTIITVPEKHAPTPVDARLKAIMDMQDMRQTARVASGSMAAKDSFMLNLPYGTQVELPNRLVGQVRATCRETTWMEALHPLLPPRWTCKIV